MLKHAVAVASCSDLGVASAAPMRFMQHYSICVQGANVQYMPYSVLN